MGIAFMLYNSDKSPLPSGNKKVFKYFKRLHFLNYSNWLNVLGRVLTAELGWVASILGIGGLAGTVAAGWMADRFGRKNSLLAMAFPEIVSLFQRLNFRSKQSVEQFKL